MLSPVRFYWIYSFYNNKTRICTKIDYYLIHYWKCKKKLTFDHLKMSYEYGMQNLWHLHKIRISWWLVFSCFQLAYVCFSNMLPTPSVYKFLVAVSPRDDDYFCVLINHEWVWWFFPESEIWKFMLDVVF